MDNNRKKLPLAVLLLIVCCAFAQMQIIVPNTVITANGTCVVFPKVNQLPQGPFVVEDDYPMPYVVTAPGYNVTASQTNCSSFNSDDDGGAPTYAKAANICYALGHLKEANAMLIDVSKPSAGLLVEYAGGVGGRRLVYNLTCDPSAVGGQGPTHAAQTGDVYTIFWANRFSCDVAPTQPSACPAGIPKPTPDLLLFQEMELGALICYNMATTTGTQGCAAHSVPDVTKFTSVAPPQTNTRQWCNAISSFGGKYATIVAKHVCGFTIWPTKAMLSGRNFTYDYTVPEGRDILRSFAEDCSSVGVKLGIYYSVVSNEYLNVAAGKVRDPSTATPGQVVVSQEEYADIVAQQLSELWTNYGDLAEIWFDGGFAVPGLEAPLLSLLNRTQPHASIFNGCGLSKNPVLWIGTESGHAPYPIWNTQDDCSSGAGTPFGKKYIPKEVDLTLQNGDTWFYREGTGYRSLPEMVGIYHDSVGHGGNMLLNVAPPPNSTIPDVAIKEYQALGSFIRNCYGEGATASPTAFGATNRTCIGCTDIKLTFDKQEVVDRVIIKEDLSGGQLVHGFTLSDDSGGIVFNGSAIGRTVIVLLDHNITTKSMTLNITSQLAPASIRLFAIPNPKSCNVGSAQGGCYTLPDTLIEGPVFATSTVPSVEACCTACRLERKCVVFTAVSSSFSQYKCSLLNAEQGSTTQSGTYSGSPL